MKSIAFASVKNTWPGLMLFYQIFTYLWGRFLWSFINYGSNAAIYNLLKPESNKGEFRLYFELFEKSCRGRHRSEISKTNAKTLIFAIWIHPQGSQGCQKMRQDSLNMPFEVYCANIALRLKNIQKSLRKQVFFDIFFQFWWFFEVCAFLGQS